MSSTHPEPRSDSDPLLEFSAEGRDEPPASLDQAAAPEATVAVTDTPPPPAIADVNPAIDALTARVARLERAVEDARVQGAQMKSDIETLVRAAADIRARASRAPRTTVVSPAKPRHRTAPAAAALLIGAAVGVGGWIYASSWQPDAAPSAVEEIDRPSPVDASPPPVVLAPAKHEVSAPNAPTAFQAPKAPKAAKAPGAPSAPSAPRYVGTLSIDAAPDGEVFINRRTAGHTPLRVTNLKAGSHLVWIERDGYRRWTRVVQVPADRVSRVWADLDPIAER